MSAATGRASPFHALSAWVEVNTGRALRPSEACRLTSAMSASLSETSPSCVMCEREIWATIGTNTRIPASAATTSCSPARPSRHAASARAALGSAVPGSSGNWWV